MELNVEVATAEPSVEAAESVAIEMKDHSNEPQGKQPQIILHG